MKKNILATFCILVLSGCQTTGTSALNLGEGGTIATGSAAGSTSIGSSVNRCDQPVGTLAVADGKDEVWFSRFQSTTGVNSVEPIIRQLAQQTNCFVVTSTSNREISAEIDRLRDVTRNSGEFRPGSSYQPGQQVAADFLLVSNVLYAGDNTDGAGGALNRTLADTGLIGIIAGGLLQTSNTAVTMSLFSIRDGVQLAATEGSASATQTGTLFSSLTGGSGPIRGATASAGGKATVGAFVDAFEKLVPALKNYEAQQVEGGLGTGGNLEVGF